MKRPSSSTMADTTELPPPPPSNNRKKKTRELPNLSDCQCCKVRINCTNPKNRLQILASEWRIVLLCKCCYNLVESSKYCSYCLTRVLCSSMESCYECKRCHRRVHKECVSMFSFGSGDNGSNSDEFSVCFDCWIPKLVENDINARVMDNRSRRKGGKGCGESLNSLGSSGVCNSQEKGKAVEGAVEDVCAVAQKKVVVAIEAKEKALDKEMDARRALVLASSAVGLVGVEKEGDRRGSVVEDDAQLAIRLHRVMNSSPRISRNACLLNTHCVDVPDVNGHFDCLDSRAAIETACSGRPIDDSRGDVQNGLSETRPEWERQYARAEDEKHIGDSGGGLITYCRKGRKPLEGKCKEEPDCFPCSPNGGWSAGDVRTKEEPDCSWRTYRRRLKKAKQCKMELGYCYKTYSRRHSVIPKSKSNSIYGSCNLDVGTHDRAISLKCCEESRALTNTS